MKEIRLFSKLHWLSCLVLWLCPILPSHGQINLSGTTYLQTFDSLGSGLPAGWSVRTGANATNLGSNTTFNSATTSWSSSTGAFNNYASADNAGFTGSESVATQAAATDRALGLRQTASFGDPGAAFVFELADTSGYQNFQLSLQLQMLSVQGRSSVWTIDYATGSTPSSFTALGTYTDPGIFGSTSFSYNFGNTLDNLDTAVWIRISSLASSTGTGSRDTVAIDNFQLNYNPVSVPEPSSPTLLLVGLTLVGLYSALAPSVRKS